MGNKQFAQFRKIFFKDCFPSTFRQKKRLSVCLKVKAKVVIVVTIATVVTVVTVVTIVTVVTVLAALTKIFFY